MSNTFTVHTIVLEDSTGKLLFAPYGIANDREEEFDTPITDRVETYWAEARVMYTEFFGTKVEELKPIDIVVGFTDADTYKKETV